MNTITKKVLSCLLVIALLLTVIPASAIASLDSNPVRSEDDLLEAIDNIPAGGSGEITIENVSIYLSTTLSIEEKNVVLNLKNASLYTHNQPVLFIASANFTINADDKSFICVNGTSNEMGVIRAENYNLDDDGNFVSEYALNINGGKYYVENAADDNVIVVSSGINAVLSNVYCDGAVVSTANAGLAAGKITINSGRFTNDIRAYVATGKYCAQFGDCYYVRDKEYTDEFNKILKNGKIVFDYVKPADADEAIWLICEDFFFANPDFDLSPESFNSDFTKCDLGLYVGTAQEEFHTLDVIWNYDSDVYEIAKGYIEKFPEDRDWFAVSDLELVNYWINNKQESFTGVDTFANYSGELKSYLNNSNFIFTVEVRGGVDDPFYTERIGSSKLIYNDTVYYSRGFLGARANHAIYVPESTGNTPSELIAAAQKRIDDYIGSGKISISENTDTVENYYNQTLLEYDERLADYTQRLTDAQDRLDEEMAKDPEEQDQQIISECQSEIMDCQFGINTISNYKQNFIDSFEEGGDHYFLTQAAGSYFFNVTVGEETYRFVIIKDDSKLEVPSYATVDLSTNVQVYADSSEIPLDTVVEVEKLTEGAEYEKIIETLNVGENETYDIKLHSGSLNEYVTKLDNGKFEVKIPISEKFEGKDLVVYYVDSNNKTTEYTVTVKNNFAVFTTDHFSIYTLAEVKDTPVLKSPQTGDTSNVAMWFLCLLMSGSLIVAFAYKKKKETITQ